MNYQKKYLKYRNKFLNLREQIDKFEPFIYSESINRNKFLNLREQIDHINEYNLQKGGALQDLLNKRDTPIDIICNDIGFHQHIGECWHDSFNMIFCFSDGIKEYTQKVLYNLEPNEMIEIALSFNKDKIIPYIFKYNKSSYDDFIEKVIEYLQLLKDRFTNHYNHITGRSTPIQRSISNVCGVNSANNIIKLSNINRDPTVDIGGYHVENYLTSLIFSFALLEKNKNLVCEYKKYNELELSDLTDLNSVIVSFVYENK